MKSLIGILAVVTLAGCAGKLDYYRPGAQPAMENEKTVARPLDQVWASTVPLLGKQFYVINNIDKSSGLINLSYSGDPEQYIDCGRVNSYVKNARGERTYNFPGASASQTYEVMSPSGLFGMQRKMELEGRVNLIFEALGPNQTKVTANSRYVVRKIIHSRDTEGRTGAADDSVAFNSMGTGVFPDPANTGNATRCVATGKLESDILGLVR